VSANAIYNWRSQYFKYGDDAFPGKGNKMLNPIQREREQLEKELKETRLECDILNKSRAYHLDNKQKTFHFIKKYTDQFPVEMMCSLLEVSRSGYYKWLRREAGRKEESRN